MWRQHHSDAVTTTPMTGNTKFLVKTITLGWIIDSGAKQHLTTSTIGMINVVDISNLNITVGHPNGTVATISHMGDLRLSNYVILYDVLVVPGYCVSLLFVNKLIKDSKLFVGFDEDKCYIQDLDKGITLGTGSESGRLYLFDDTKNKSLGNVNTVMAFNVSKDLWHSRLCHPADKVLNVLKNDLNLSKNTSVSVCETCHMAKQTREPFPLSDHKSVKPGELVHLDLWGPYRVSSREGFKYFLTIVDDYSRAGGIPLNFWSDCILTAVYLINRLPSLVLNGSDKLTSRSEKYVLIGYSPVKKAYKLFSLDNRSVLFARDVRFYETVFPFKMKNTKRNDLADVDYTSDAELLTFFDNQITPSPNDEERATPCVEGGVHSSTDDENSNLNIVAPTRDHSPKDVQPNVRRSSRPTKMPAKFNDFMLDSKLKYGIEKHVNYSKLNTANYCFATTLNKSVEPTTYYDAVKDVRWVEAMNNEIEALIRNNTWTLTDLPIGRKTIDNKWLYKIKYKASGQVDKYKARVVAKGFSQREGIDFDETFSPVVKMVTIRCLICIVVSNDWPLFQLDVNNAFLYGDLNEDIYMSLPLGFECSDKTKHGFVQSKNDYSLYIKHTDGVFVALLVYVDDFIITGNSLDEVENFKLFLKSKFMIKDLGVMKYFLGIEVLDNSNGICMTQRKYCLELIHEFGLLAAKPVTTPLPENCVLVVDESESDKFLKNIFEYQKLLGKLIYLTHTRPDISYVVHCLSQHMHAPLQSHLKVALRVIRYLKNSPGGFLFLRKSRNKPLYPDPLLRLNTDVWQVPLMNSAIQIAANPVFHERTKHFEVDVHLVREKVEDGVINTIKVASADQTADLFTKGHGSTQHLKLCNQLSLVDMFGKTFYAISVSLEGPFLAYSGSCLLGLVSC
ncbi:ribonuclease H-like domain-containing protein [Tanacetum coccineum]